MALWTRRIAMKLRGKAVFLFLVEISCDETFRSLLYETTEEPLWCIELGASSLSTAAFDASFHTTGTETNESVTTNESMNEWKMTLWD